MDYSPPGSSIHVILQARVLAWVAISFCRGSSWPRDRTQVLPHCKQVFYHLIPLSYFIINRLFGAVLVFLAALGLPLVARVGASLIVMWWLLIALASLVADMGSRRLGFSSCSTWAQYCGVWAYCPAACGIFIEDKDWAHLPCLAGGFLTTGPPGKSLTHY